MLEYAIILAAAVILAVWLTRHLRHRLHLRAANARPHEGSRLAGLGITAHLRDFYRLAVMIEEEGTAFYLKMAERERNPDTKNLCLSLAADETVHKRVFQEQLDNWQTLPPSRTEWPVLMAQVKKAGLFENAPAAEATEEEMARFALRQEIKTAEFYEFFEQAFPDAWRTSKMHALVLEERSHEAKLRAAHPYLQ